MPRRCTICEHPQQREIDKALIAGSTLQHLSGLFGVSLSALFRHRKEHLPALLAKAKSAEPPSQAVELETHQQAVNAKALAHALDVVQQLKAINSACLEVLKQARSQAQAKILLQAVDRIHRQIEFQARLLRDLDEEETSPNSFEEQWSAVRQLVIEALSPYPEARLAVAQALSHAEA